MRSTDLNIISSVVIGRIPVSMLLSICTSMACKEALVLAVSCIMAIITVVILIMQTLTSTPLTTFSNNLRISTGASILTGINIRGRVY